MEQQKIQIDNKLISLIFGSFDSNIQKIENEYEVSIVNRGDDIVISGEADNIKHAVQVLNALVKTADKGEEISEQSLNYFIDEAKEDNIENAQSVSDDYICTTVNGRALHPKTIGQKKYIDSIRNNTIVFGVGPAGTGKTYLAMAMAITAFKNNEVNRIILTRPAIEAGENLGFLPGDLQQKVDPYLRPLYDALYEIMGADTFLRNIPMPMSGAMRYGPAK